MAQWYGDRLLICFPQGYPGSIPGVGVCAIAKSNSKILTRIEPQVRFLEKVFSSVYDN